MRLASMVLPEPGGPIIRRLWPPAAAISMARLAVCWPRTSRNPRRIAANFPSRAWVSTFTGATPLPRIQQLHHLHQRLARDKPQLLPPRAASRALTSGTISLRILLVRAITAMGSAPRTPRTPPSSESSPTKSEVVRRLVVQAAVSAEDAERHRQVEARAFLANVGGSQVDGDGGGGNVVAAVLQGSANALAALPYRCVGQTDGGEEVFVAF